MKKRLFSFMLLVSQITIDCAVISVSYIGGYILKFKLKLYPQAQIEPFLEILPIMLAIWILTFLSFGLYRPIKGILESNDEVYRLLKAATVATLLSILLKVIYPDMKLSRYVMVYTYALSFVLLLITRNIFHFIKRHIIHLTHPLQRCAIVGIGDQAQYLSEKIKLFPTIGFKVIGFLGNKKPKILRYHIKKDFVLLGRLSNINKIIKKYKIKVLIIADDSIEHTQLIEKINPKLKQTITIIVSPTLIELTSKPITMLDETPLIKLESIGLAAHQRLVKRIFDITSASLLLLSTSPIFLISSISIKLTSKGSVFFRQQRVSSMGKTFMCIKFRTMKTHSPAILRQTKSILDKRITSIGKFLRKTSIDELPQLLNVLKGDMSLVGPRPEQPFFCKKLNEKIPSFDLRHKVKSGITGWAQVNGRSDLTTKPKEKLKYDLFYIENWSIVFDLRIIFRTILQVLLHKDVI
ncbi:sugar transferase [Candidatus Margulisiibacteriota bacterium]